LRFTRCAREAVRVIPFGPVSCLPRDYRRGSSERVVFVDIALVGNKAERFSGENKYFANAGEVASPPDAAK